MGILSEAGKRIIFFDGGMGTQLQEKGLKPGELPELWNITHPDKIIDIHLDYLEAGADIILTNTFGANSLKYENNLEEIVEAAVSNAKKAIEKSGKDALVALDIGPTGKLLKPIGTLDFEEAVSIFSKTVSIGQKAGADLILIETMNDTYELKAAVLAAKENSSLPVMATAIFDENEKMLTGGSPQGLVAMLEGLGVDALGINCGLGPQQMKPVCEKILACASIPVIVKPNAGLPKQKNGSTVFDVNPQQFANYMKDIISMGVWYAGGCCGTTPAHIRELVRLCKDIKPLEIVPKDITVVSSYCQTVEIGDKPVIVGERINPTGKSKFKQALRDHNMAYIIEEGVNQEESGAHILDVNVGLPEIDEPAFMKETVYELQSVLSLPLQIDTTNIAAMEQALRIYNGKPMINSVNGKEDNMRQIFPLVKKYGGVVVGLTIDEKGIPESVEGRLKIAKKIFDTAAEYGIDKKNIIIDALTMTISTSDAAAAITLDTVKALKENGIKTILGVSNVSFGLPKRNLINAAFYLLAMENGLSAAIINPNSLDMKRSYDLYYLLHGYDKQCSAYIEKYANMLDDVMSSTTAVTASATTAASSNASSASDYKKNELDNSSRNISESKYTLKECIIKGLKDQAAIQTKKTLLDTDPMDVINNELVPGLDIVGKGFENKTMFLPQLLMSAEAAQAGFAAIKEHIEANGIKQSKKATIVLATVKGDIHDIGKNIVKVLLENYGYEVIDLGKDVDSDIIVDKVVELKAPIAGLSALMTTTVINMEETIKKLRLRAPWCKIMVGGAVLTQEYADSIGADFYGKDAMQSVYYVQNLT